MNVSKSYMILLFDSTSATLLAEKVLKKEGIPIKIIPVPRHISSDCGVCIRVSPQDREKIEELLADVVDRAEICVL
ncbi:MAG: DUF3343 domain-containing protein [Deltaproteobacteria bacterium]|nr:DUF3343 domain-containing protein [Deltaproteobacteria bacterium]MBN2686918.1 DUF3343 domain-containing protein [Deltaproteobacteria bacterium]